MGFKFGIYLIYILIYIYHICYAHVGLIPGYDSNIKLRDFNVGFENEFYLGFMMLYNLPGIYIFTVLTWVLKVGFSLD